MDAELKCLNLCSADLKALSKIGIASVKDVFPGDLKKRNISADEWKDLIKEPPLKSAYDLLNETINDDHLFVSGISNLDEALGGGFAFGHIVELCGLPGSGRSHLCLQLSVNVTLPQQCNGLDGEVCYLYTNRCCNRPRLEIIAEKCINNYKRIFDGNMLNINNVLDKVNTLEMKHIGELMAFPRYLKLWVKEHKLKLLVIDNISHIFKRFHNYKKWRIFLYKTLGQLQELATKYKFVILITNDMTTRFTNSFDVTFTPCLAASLFHRVNTRIIVTNVKGRTNTYKATIAKNVATNIDEVYYALN